MRQKLVSREGDHYLPGTSRVHLGTSSPMITRHHINWRMQAIGALEREDGRPNDALHYSSVVSVATDDVLKIKSLLVKAIENTKKVVRESGEEELHSICLDFFRV